MTIIDPNSWRAARRALEKAVTLHLDDPNVTLIDLGFRTRSSRGHRIERELAVRVHVRRKLHGESFERYAERHPHWVIDAQRLGFAVDVPEACYAPLCCNEAWRAPETQATHHPTISGGRVRDGKTHKEMLLTTHNALISAVSATRANNHHPSSGGSDGGAEIAVEYVRDAMDAHLDAAVACIHGRQLLLEDCGPAGSVIGPGLPALGTRVIKRAHDGAVVDGVISGILGCMLHRYDGRLRLIRHVVHIAPVISGDEFKVLDDSGSWWVEPADGAHRAVGMHFAGSEKPRFALALSMPEVLNALDVDIIADRAENSRAHFYAAGPDDGDVQPDAAESTYAHMKASLTGHHGAAAKTVLIALAVPLLAGFYDWQLPRFAHPQRTTIAMQNDISSLQSAAKFDSVRQLGLRKTISIINRFNPNMAAQGKYGIANEIFQMSLKYPNLDTDLICATITHESGRSWNPRSVSPVGAMGLMQVMPSTGVALARQEGIEWKSAEEVLFDPAMNIRLGCRYLSALVETYSIDGGLAAYNGGEKRAERWLNSGRADGILHEETAFYVPAILKIYEQYRRRNI